MLTYDIILPFDLVFSFFTSHNLLRVGRKRRVPESVKTKTVVLDNIQEAIKTKTPFGRMKRMVAKKSEIFM